jgi:dipeptidyl aminopeptidase/acylaminoacyl peptidase
MMSINRVLRLLMLAAAGCSCAVASQALRAQSFTIEQVLSAPFPSQLTAAHQGSRIAWVFAQRGAQNVWVADGPEFVLKQVTHYSGDTGQPIASLRLSPDGKSVVFARGTEVNGEGRSANPLAEAKQPKQQVWIASVESGEPRLLGDMGCEAEGCEDIQIAPDGKWAVWETKHELWIASTTVSPADAKQLTDIRSSVSSPQWSPDGAHLVATVGRRDHSLTAVLDVQGGVLQGVHYIAPSTDRDLAPQWSPDGGHIAFLRVGGAEAKRPLIPQRVTPWSLWVADAHTYTAAPIWKSGDAPRDSLPPFATEQLLFAADGKVVFSSEADGRNHLYSIAATGGSTTLLTPGDYDVEEASLSPDKRSVLLSSNEDDIDRRHTWKVPVAGGSAPEALAKGDTIEWSPVATGDGKELVCLGSSAVTPGLVYRLSGGARELITKDALPKDFPAAQLVIPKQVILKAADGLTIHGQLFVPKGQSKPGPALIFTHGGPPRQMMLGFSYMDYYSNAYAENQYLASLGFTVLSVNYRLGIMYGHDFRDPPNACWRGAAEYQDVLAGAHYLQGLPTVDPKRIGLWGGSYGGFLTALGLARNSDIFAAGVDFHGVHDWSDFLPSWEEGAGSAPDLKEAEKLAFSSSPNASIATWKSPVLLIQGDDDRNVPFSQMVSLVQKLRAQHVPFEEIVYPDEIHDFLLWKDFVRSYHATADFLQKYLEAK